MGKLRWVHRGAGEGIGAGILHLVEGIPEHLVVGYLPIQQGVDFGNAEAQPRGFQRKSFLQGVN